MASPRAWPGATEIVAASRARRGAPTVAARAADARPSDRPGRSAPRSSARRSSEPLDTRDRWSLFANTLRLRQPRSSVQQATGMSVTITMTELTRTIGEAGCAAASSVREMWASGHARRARPWERHSHDSRQNTSRAHTADPKGPRRSRPTTRSRRLRGDQGSATRIRAARSSEVTTRLDDIATVRVRSSAA